MQVTTYIEKWDDTHARWGELQLFLEAEGQTRWADIEGYYHLSNHRLVALRNDQIAGFLRYITQTIGVEEDHEPVALNGNPLIEAKVLAFAVAEPFRNQGIGRQLQERTIRLAREIGCYQLRSHSSGENDENHHLKLSMGFAVHPIVRDDDTRGVYFILPLVPDNQG